MSLIRTALIIGAAIFLLPADEKKQAAFSATATKAAAETATFCERNVHTCGAGRELWSLFLHKAQYGMELGARLVREQFLHGTSSENASMSSSPPSLSPQSTAATRYHYEKLADPAAGKTEQLPPRRSDYPTDNPSRWR